MDVGSKEHRNDRRDYIYTSEELEDASTHDPYWNAAQLEMVHTNKVFIIRASFEVILYRIAVIGSGGISKKEGWRE
uniref:Uncharacterized protein n=1 Tax=Parascaris equorum TaxID=6256 RepID=A0A914RYE2_PAREQ